ncbi:MAG: hypothetical protein J6B98_06540 [Bacilli bacterium]|jgi:hypothetical protein|nr:hypothetical protein [Bacilli bacterium]
MRNLLFRPTEVVCLDYRKVYSSTSLASELTGCNRTSIIKCCKGMLNACYNSHNRRLKWMYAKDFIEQYGIEAFQELHSTSSDFY